MEEKREKIIKKIKKLLSLSKSQNENEAISAALKAQKLMVQYDVEERELERNTKKEKIIETRYEVGTGDKWKYSLANLIAVNFRCECYYQARSVMIFYGHETDAVVAKNVYEYLFNIGKRLGKRLVHKTWREGKSTKGVYNSFVRGFVDGIKTKLEQQCKALMIVVPKDVSEGFEILTKDVKRIDTTVSVADDDSYREGVYQGKLAVDGRELKQTETAKKSDSQILYLGG